MLVRHEGYGDPFNPNISFSKKSNAKYGPTVFRVIIMGAAALGVSIFGYAVAARRWKTASCMLHPAVSVFRIAKSKNDYVEYVMHITGRKKKSKSESCVENQKKNTLRLP